MRWSAGASRIFAMYAVESEPNAMSSIQPAKPLASAIVTLLWLSSFVFIDTTQQPFLGLFYMSAPEANAWKWAIISVLGLLWLLLQIFMQAPGNASRFSLSISGTILWLGLLLFYRFQDPAYGGTVAFFALVGGLLVTIVWVRYLADEAI
jgi:hypothetical protein